MYIEAFTYLQCMCVCVDIMPLYVSYLLIFYYPTKLLLLRLL